jgi:hypothetical protein
MAQRWAYAVSLAAILVVSVALLRIDRGRAPHPPTPTLSEDEILQHIQTDVSTDVPSALAPGELLLAGAEETPAPVREKAPRKTKKVTPR